MPCFAANEPSQIYAQYPSRIVDVLWRCLSNRRQLPISFHVSIVWSNFLFPSLPHNISSDCSEFHNFKSLIYDSNNCISHNFFRVFVSSEYLISPLSSDIIPCFTPLYSIHPLQFLHYTFDKVSVETAGIV